MMAKRGVSCALLLLVLVAAASAQETATLRYQFNPDEVLSYTMNVTGGGRVVVGGTPLGEFAVPLDMIVNGAFDLLIKDVDDEGNGHLGLRLGEMNMAVTALGRTMRVAMDLEKGTFTVDGQAVPFPPRRGPGGEAPAEPPVAPGEAISKLSFVMSPRGALLNVEGLEEFAAALRQGNPMGAMNPMAIPNVAEMLKGYAPAFPEGELAAGDTWEQTLTFPAAGAAPLQPLTVRYSLEEFGHIGDHQVVRIGMKGDWEARDLPMQAPAGVAGPVAGGKLDLLAMAVEGELYFDTTAGAMHTARLAVTMNMEMSAAAPPAPPPAAEPVLPPPPPGAAGAPPPEEREAEPVTEAEAPPAEAEVAPAAPQMTISIKDLKLYYEVHPAPAVEEVAAQP